MKKAFIATLAILILLTMLIIPNGTINKASSLTYAKTDNIYFVKNLGQTGKNIDFYAKLKNGYAFFGNGFFGFSTIKNGKVFSYKIMVSGKPKPIRELKTKISYFKNGVGLAQIPTFEKLVYSCKGYTVSFFSKNGNLKWDIKTKNLDNVKLKYITNGARLRATNNILTIEWKEGRIKEKISDSFSKGSNVKISYSVSGNNIVSFKGNTKDVVIDPSTYLGGSGNDVSYTSFATDSAVYVAGYTYSANFPTTPGVYEESFQGNQDAFISKFSKDLSTLIASTIIGGNKNDGINKLVIDNNTVYVTGYTDSTNFPVSQNAYSTTNNGYEDAFVAILNSDLSQLEYATYIGGSANDRAYAICVTNNSVYIAGGTYSNDFPVTSNAYDTTSEALSSNYYKLDAFVSEFDKTLSTLKASTYLEGSSYDIIRAMEIYENHVYVAGYTYSTNFPTTSNAFAHNNSGSFDSFVSELDANLSALIASTYIGGSNADFCYDLSVNPDGVYIVGGTYSDNFPVTNDGFQNTYHGASQSWGLGGDGFVSELNLNLSAISHSSYIGGSKDDNIAAIKIKNNRIYLTGTTKSNDFPIKGNTFDKTFNGNADAFVGVMKKDLSDLTLSTYLGGSNDDRAGSISLSSNGIYVSGSTYSTDFPVTQGAYDTTYNGGGNYNQYGGGDVFVTGLTYSLQKPIPVLHISKTGPAYTLAGSVATYQITISNSGTSTSHNTTVKDFLPNGVYFISSIPQPNSVNSSISGEVITWNMEDLSPNGSKTITYRVKLPYFTNRCMNITNIAEVSGTDAKTVKTTFSTLVCASQNEKPNPPNEKPNPPKPPNAHPINITINPPEKICINTDSKFVFTFTGGTPPYIYTVNFGDGTEDIKGKEEGKFITLIHTYKNEGKYTVKIDVKDKDNTESVLSRTIYARSCTVVLKVYHSNFIIGYPDGEFKPNRNVTRAEISTMLVRALGINAERTFNHMLPFSDVKPNHWALNFIKKIYEEKLMLGDKSGTFRPDRFATRAEIATVLVRLRGLKPEIPQEQLFNDVKENDWFNGYVYTAVKAGLIQGYPDHSFKPNNPVSRAEFVTMLDRVLYREDVAQVNKYEGIKNVRMFPDVKADFWAYKYILEAAFPHVITYATRAPINISVPSKTIPVYIASTKSTIIFPKLGSKVKAIVPVDGLINGKEPEPRTIDVRIVNEGTP